MKKPEIFFRPIDGSAPLSVYFYDGPYGDAIEAINEEGVGFFSATGDLLAVQFDDISEVKDHKILEFKGGLKVEVNVKNKKISVSVHYPQKKSA